MISILLVILVVFLFLREVRSTLIPTVAVPLSLLGTFAVMYLLGYTLDNLSLNGADDLDGVCRRRCDCGDREYQQASGSGMTPFAAAMVGSKEIGFTVVSMSTSLIAVFIPILLMGGIVGGCFVSLR